MMKHTTLLVLALLLASCVDSEPAEDAPSGGEGGKGDDGTGGGSVMADPVSKVFGIASFEVTMERRDSR